MIKGMTCPYKATKNNACTHKGTKKNKGGKSVCNYKYPHNCQLFIDWFENKGRIDCSTVKTPKEAS